MIIHIALQEVFLKSRKKRPAEVYSEKKILH